MELTRLQLVHATLVGQCSISIGKSPDLQVSDFGHNLQRQQARGLERRQRVWFVDMGQQHLHHEE
jgi:hypothetical protein